MTDQIAELEFGLHHWTINNYTVELRYSPPPTGGDTERDKDLDYRTFGEVKLDFSSLSDATLSAEEYGRCLTDAVFAHPEVKSGFAHACDSAASLGAVLRLRLFIGPSASDLHAHRWELLRDPRGPDGPWLATSERVYVSRYIGSFGHVGALVGKRTRLRPKSDLTFLVVVANPKGLGSDEPGTGYADLAPIDVEDELARIAPVLNGRPHPTLAQPGSATLKNIERHLSEGIDVLYLVCHGKLVDDEPILYLEDDKGAVDLVNGHDLIAMMRGQEQLPRLVVLVSCDSAGDGAAPVAGGEGPYLRALGPRLAEIGVPAVLAIQGDFKMKAAAQFLPKFFEVVRTDGKLDRAMNLARREVTDKEEAWRPALFLRLRTGRLWYEPGLGTFEKWDTLITAFERNECTPILGPVLHESLIGSVRDIALSWAQSFGFPLAQHDADELHHVAQYISVNQARNYPAIRFEEHLKELIKNEFKKRGREADPSLSLLELVKRFEEERKREEEERKHEFNPYKVLADLPVDLFITASPVDLLEEALRTRTPERKPVSVVHRWNQFMQRPVPIRDSDIDVDHPLVYHVFGHFGDLRSLVLSEDNYLEFLLGARRGTYEIAKRVLSSTTERSIVFLGFRPDDWSFRVLFRTLITSEGLEWRNQHVNVAVQVDPDDDQFVSPERARQYLEDYFKKESITIYWGSAEDFLTELAKRRKPPT